MKFLVVGLGSIGRRHFQNLWHLGFRDLTAVEIRRRLDPPQREFFAKYQPRVFRDLGSALRKKPDAVFICNPTSLHVTTARLALHAGAHVFIEKPISNSRAGVSALIREAGKRRLVIYVGYHFRHHPHLRLVKRLVAGGHLGEILSARFYTGEYLPFWHPGEDYRQSYAARRKLGGGVLLTQSHDLDIVCWLCGTPERVSAKVLATRALKISVDDSADMLFSFSLCPAVSIHLDYLANPPVKRAEILGTKGRLEWNYHARILRYYDRDGKEKAFTLPKRFERNDMYLSELREFFRAIRGHLRSYCDGRAGRTVLEMCLRAKESSRRQKILPIRI